jgi:hypothetical protein
VHAVVRVDDLDEVVGTVNREHNTVGGARGERAAGQGERK